MDNKNQSKLKLRIFRMFSSSFGSCKSKNITDVVQRPPPPPPPPTVVHHRRHRQLFEPISPKPKPFPLTHQKKWSKVVETVDQNCSSSKDRIFYRKKVMNRKRKPTRLRKKETFDSYYEFFSSDDEDEEDDRTTLFSSKSLSSDSSENRRGIGSHRRRRRKAAPAPAKGNMKLKESTAVAKRSRDPYSDFRNSMVEMIVEKQIFAENDLENLLQMFLDLNSSRHHRVIVEVYTDIWEALFSDRC
ncbi:transcription repressor OFP8-like [Impatiens glandulifera]|uniref:transcription repressor OFP8-like n=1 Tax=Impatiens glandulifera TaxID=253017 RepID=UPI001FB12E61|nr:transcription repressor OFP8-like [Impatiens glandulifera]